MNDRENGISRRTLGDLKRGFHARADLIGRSKSSIWKGGGNRKLSKNTTNKKGLSYDARARSPRYWELRPVTFGKERENCQEQVITAVKNKSRLVNGGKKHPPTK